jgi:hypothetical protein
MKLSFTVVAMIAALVLFAERLAAQTPADLLKAARDRDQAVDKADAAAWDRLTTDDFTVVNETGRLLTKAERIAELRKQKPDPSLSPCQQEQIKVYGDTAVRRCLDSGVRVIEVWVKSIAGWRAAAVQVTTVSTK